MTLAEEIGVVICDAFYKAANTDALEAKKHTEP